ncbi:MAG: conjugal transfer protein TraG N-terminal domain-containing protein [Gilliamella apicola]|nr:conjugal transfer protein TraG N-terminal domain-containing protein [Gilliamella apicola]
MFATNFFDYVTLSLAWYINNGIWNVISSTGIFILPFIFKIYSIFISVRKEGSFDGDHAPTIINQLETYIFISILVIFFACYPSIPLQLKIMHFEQTHFSLVINGGKWVKRNPQCTYNEVSPRDSQFNSHIMVGGQTAYVPLWWYFIHSLSSGFTQASITTLPCNTDLREVQEELTNIYVTDPLIMSEAEEFNKSCFNPAFNKYLSLAGSLPDNLIDDLTWPGSNYFLTTPGYYDTFRAENPQKDWPYDTNRDVGLSPGKYGTGYPNCKEWWSDNNVGIKKKIIKNIDMQISASRQNYRRVSANPHINKFSFWDYLTLTETERDEIVLRNIFRSKFKPQNTILVQSHMFTNYENIHKSGAEDIGSFLASYGTFFKSMSTSIEMSAVKKAAPMIQSVLLMCIIILLPIVTVLGGYDPKIIITLTFVIFTLIFLTFVWELSRFLDSKLIEIVFENNVISFCSDEWSRGSKSLINLVTSMAFIGLPLLLLGAISWTGFQIGVGVSSAIGISSNKMQQAGKEGANKGSEIASKAGDALKTAATKGK